MAIHQTKLVMEHAHTSSPKATANPRNQPSGVRLESTTWLIVSVTELNVCPGAMTAGVRASSAAVSPDVPGRSGGAILGFLLRGRRLRVELGVRIPHECGVGGSR